VTGTQAENSDVLCSPIANVAVAVIAVPGVSGALSVIGKVNEALPPASVMNKPPPMSVRPSPCVSPDGFPDWSALHTGLL